MGKICPWPSPKPTFSSWPYLKLVSWLRHCVTFDCNLASFMQSQSKTGSSVYSNLSARSARSLCRVTHSYTLLRGGYGSARWQQSATHLVHKDIGLTTKSLPEFPDLSAFPRFLPYV